MTNAKIKFTIPDNTSKLEPTVSIQLNSYFYTKIPGLNPETKDIKIKNGNSEDNQKELTVFSITDVLIVTLPELKEEGLAQQQLKFYISDIEVGEPVLIPIEYGLNPSSIVIDMIIYMKLYPLDEYMLDYYYLTNYNTLRPRPTGQFVLKSAEKSVSIARDLMNLMKYINHEIVNHNISIKRQDDSLYFACAIMFLFKTFESYSFDSLALIPSCYVFTVTMVPLKELMHLLSHEFSTMIKHYQYMQIYDNEVEKGVINKPKLMRTSRINKFIKNLEFELFEMLEMHVHATIIGLISNDSKKNELISHYLTFRFDSRQFNPSSRSSDFYSLTYLFLLKKFLPFLQQKHKNIAEKIKEGSKKIKEEANKIKGEEKGKIQDATGEIIDEAEKITKESEKIKEEKGKIQDAAGEIIDEAEKITKESEKIKEEANKIEEESEKIIDGTGKIGDEIKKIQDAVGEITKNITKKSEKIKDESEKIIAETKKIIDETIIIRNKLRKIKPNYQEIINKAQKITQYIFCSLIGNFYEYDDDFEISIFTECSKMFPNFKIQNFQIHNTPNQNFLDKKEKVKLVPPRLPFQKLPRNFSYLTFSNIVLEVDLMPSRLTSSQSPNSATIDQIVVSPNRGELTFDKRKIIFECKDGIKVCILYKIIMDYAENIININSNSNRAEYQNESNIYALFIYDGKQSYKIHQFSVNQKELIMEHLKKCTGKQKSEYDRLCKRFFKEWKRNGMFILQKESSSRLIKQPNQQLTLFLDRLLDPKLFTLPELQLLMNSCLRSEEVALETLRLLKGAWMWADAKKEEQIENMVRVSKGIFTQTVAVSSSRIFRELMEWVESLKDHPLALRCSKAARIMNDMIRIFSQYKNVNVHQIAPKHAGKFFEKNLIEPYLSDCFQ